MSGFFRSAALEETRASIEERQRTADVALIVLQRFAPGQSRIRDRIDKLQVASAVVAFVARPLRPL